MINSSWSAVSPHYERHTYIPSAYVPCIHAYRTGTTHWLAQQPNVLLSRTKVKNPATCIRDVYILLMPLPATRNQHAGQLHHIVIQLGILQFILGKASAGSHFEPPTTSASHSQLHKGTLSYTALGICLYNGLLS